MDARKLVVLAGLAVLAGCGNPPADAPVATPAPSAATTAAPAGPAANPLRNPYFGDLHLHTSYSADAFALGTTTTPADAYRYAMGETVEYFGNPQKRTAPLDFLAVTDHAEYLGVVRATVDPNGPFAGTDWFRMMTSGDPKVAAAAFKKIVATFTTNEPLPEFSEPAVLTSAWKRYAAIADELYQPGRFTTFVGFEWTSAPGFQNLHRCVIFADKGPDLPYSAFDSQNPEDLWTYLEAQRARGLEVIAVPHNGNASNGLMFDIKDLSGKPLTREYAARRMANEPLAEIIQGKGQSETSPALSPNDEFAQFEMWAYLIGTDTRADSATGSYLRQAYGVGQELQATLGTNPFKYGIEGGTDFHSGLSSTEADNYPGSHGSQDNDPRAVLTATTSVGGEPPTSVGSGGLTGVWAEENTRASIFAALRRKETFGTSGTRIKVRLFGGWSYPRDLQAQPDWVRTAYANGVPMGGDLPAAPAGSRPTFVFAATKDPDSGNLDRIQIVKVWTANGRSQEKVFDVAWSGDRRPDPKSGKLPPVGNTVNVATATYTDDIGSVELSGTWTDTEFDPGAYATYYARVLEIPTPRWSTYWAAKLKLPPNPGVPATVQQRAWTSPIWYAPAK